MNRYQLSGLNYAQLIELRNEVSAALKEKKAQINPESEKNRNARRARQKWMKRLARSEKRSVKRPKNQEEIDVFLNNSSSILSPPGIGKIPASTLSGYFPALIAQKWLDGEDEDGDYYVYAHVDARKNVFKTTAECGGNWRGLPFYIGKGIGRRAYDLKRNQGHGKRIGELLSIGITPEQIVHIAFSGLSERKALEIEAKCIYFFGSIYSPGKAGKRGCLLNLDVPKVHEFQGVMMSIPSRKNPSTPGVQND